MWAQRQKITYNEENVERDWEFRIRFLLKILLLIIYLLKTAEEVHSYKKYRQLTGYSKWRILFKTYEY